MTQTFFIHIGKRAHLYCKVVSHEGVVLKGWVINGAWDFTLYTDIGLMQFHSPFGLEERRGCEVLWTTRKFTHYNDAILWADAHLSRPVWLQVAIELYDNIASTVSRFASRLKRACKAFSDAWYGRVNDGVPY